MSLFRQLVFCLACVTYSLTAHACLPRPMHYAVTDTPFLRAIADNNVNEVKTFLSDNKASNLLSGDSGNRALHTAVFWGATDALRLLHAAGANVSRNATLFESIFASQVDIGDRAALISTVTSLGLAVNSKIPERGTPLVQAIASQPFEIVQALIYAGADVNREQAICTAARLGSPDVFKLLLRSGAKLVNTCHRYSGSKIGRAHV